VKPSEPPLPSPEAVLLNIRNILQKAALIHFRGLLL
jgi:hypothetical protein